MSSVGNLKKEKNYEIQILRAVAIIAVVLIHTCPLGIWQPIVKPFVNFAVALFLFISGYLTKDKIVDYKQFYKKRISKVLIPYIIWTVIYSICEGNSSRILLNLLTSKANGILYYIFVYIQFVLLTPFLFKLIKSKFYLVGYIIAPVSVILFKYIWLIPGLELNPYIDLVYGISCIGWFTFYYLGLSLGNNKIKKEFKINRLVFYYLITIIMQLVEGLILFAIGDAKCGTQLKISSLLSSSVFILIAYCYLNNGKLKKNNKILKMIGDYSFGIYLVHVLIMKLLAYVPGYSYIPYIINSAIILFLSLGIVYVCKKIFGEKISAYLGF